MRSSARYLAPLLLLGLPNVSSALSVIGAAKWGLKTGAELTLYIYERMTEPRTPPPSPAFDQVPSPSHSRAAPQSTIESDGEHRTLVQPPLLNRPSSSQDRNKWSIMTLFDAVSSDGSKYPACWRRAVLELNGSCKELDGPKTQRLALELARCHLEEAGRQLPASCDKTSDPVGPCLKELDQTSLVIYTEFFSYTSSVCFFVQSEIFQSQTEAVILALTQRTVEAVELLYNSKETQAELLDGQRRSAEAQEEIRKISVDVKSGLDESLMLMHKFREEFDEMGRLQSRALEQQRMLHGLLEQSNEELQRHAEDLAAEFAREASRLRSMKLGMERMMDGFFNIWSTLVHGACAIILLPILTVLLLFLRPYPQLLKAAGLACVLLFVLWQFATVVSALQGLWAMVNRVGITTIAFICVSLLLPNQAPRTDRPSNAPNNATSNAGSGRTGGGAASEPGTAATGASPGGRSVDQLARLPRRELQRLAKQSGVAPANARTMDIIQALASAVSSSPGAP